MNSGSEPVEDSRAIKSKIRNPKSKMTFSGRNVFHPESSLS